MSDFDFWASFIIISLIWLLSLFLFLRTDKKKRKDENSVSDGKSELSKVFLTITSLIAFFFLISTAGFWFLVFIISPPLWVICLVRFLKMRKKKRLVPKAVSEDRFFEDKYKLMKVLLVVTSVVMALFAVCTIGLIILSFFPISFM